MSLIPNSKYDNVDLYSLISENQTYEHGYIIHQQILEEKETKILFKRTLKYANPGLTKKQLFDIKERNKWERFGKANEDYSNSNKNDNEDHVFIEYNPEIFKSKKSQTTIKKMLSDPFNVDKIKVSEENKHILDNVLDKTYNELKKDKDISKDVLDYNLKYITDYKNVNNWAEKKKEKKTEEEIKNKLIKKTGAFVPSFIKKRENSTPDNSGNNSSNNTNTNNNKFVPRHKRENNDSSDNENKSIRLFNLPEPIEYSELRDWLNVFRLERYKLFLPKNKNTNENKNFCFLNFNNKEDALKSIEILNREKFNYNIIQAEISIRRN